MPKLLTLRHSDSQPSAEEVCMGEAIEKEHILGAHG